MKHYRNIQTDRIDRSTRAYEVIMEDVRKLIDERFLNLNKDLTSRSAGSKPASMTSDQKDERSQS